VRVVAVHADVQDALLVDFDASIFDDIDQPLGQDVASGADADDGDGATGSAIGSDLIRQVFDDLGEFDFTHFV